MSLAAGTKLGPYEILARISSGPLRGPTDERGEVAAGSSPWKMK